jgi:phosphate transport system permease protein
VLALSPTSSRRRRTDRAARTALAAGAAIALVPLVAIVFYLVRRGIGAFSLDFFTTDPTGAFLGGQGGIKSAVLGTIELVAMAAAVAVPLGVAVAVYLVEYGQGSRFGSLVRYFVDVMTGVPSIIFGLFIYITLILTGVLGAFTAWKGSAALALLMLPIVARSCEVVLLLVPQSLREAALALGSPRWRVILRIVLPTALPGLVTGSLLAVARAAGETAPLLFTAFGANATTFDPGGQMNSLPLQIFNDVRAAQTELVDRAWGAALTLVLMILLLNLTSRLIARRSNLR